MKNTHHTKGFTLIEIAIVVVIIGLLAGGVIKGLEILEDTRIQKTSTQISALQSAWFSYISRYQQIPGDDNQASTFLNASAQNGDGDGVLAATEQSYVWQHLHLSGILQGSGVQPASTPWGNNFEYAYDNTKNQHLLCIKNVVGTKAALLDLKMDNGMANAGTFFGLSTTEKNYNAESAYTFCTYL